MRRPPALRLRPRLSRPSRRRCSQSTTLRTASWAQRVRAASLAGACSCRAAAQHLVCAGIEAFCKDLKLDPSDRKVLILAWKMGAKRMGYFSRDEFCYGALLRRPGLLLAQPSTS